MAQLDDLGIEQPKCYRCDDKGYVTDGGNYDDCPECCNVVCEVTGSICTNDPPEDCQDYGCVKLC